MTKSHLSLSLIAALTVSSSALAATGNFGEIDANADGKITLQEGLKMHPDWTDSTFKALDTNADGALNELEYEAAVTTAPGNPDQAATTSKISSPTTAPTQTAAVVRKDGPASYLDAAGPNDVLASKLIGMRVYAVESDIDDTQAYPADSRKNWNDVGEVNDVVLDWDGSVKAVVLGVGGFLGLGEKDVAIEISSLRKVRESNDSSDWFLVVNSSKDLLISAPAYVHSKKS